MTTDEAARLAHEVIDRAVRDATSHRSPEALAWLASRQAAPWFDILGVNQPAFLERLEWPSLAAQVVASPPRPLRLDELDTISASLEALRPS